MISVVLAPSALLDNEISESLFSVYPGDTACLFKLAHISEDSIVSEIRILLLFRFWSHDESEGGSALLIDDFPTALQIVVETKSVHELFLSFRPADRSVCRRVTNVELLECKSESTLKRLPRYPSIGFLDKGGGKDSDGFYISESSEGSCHGFYFVCLNLPLQIASSLKSKRIIRVIPVEIQAWQVYFIFYEDLVKCLIEGVEVVDSSGQRTRIFIKILCVLADTPEVRDILRLGGHSAGRSCHICNFLRGSLTKIGSRFFLVKFILSSEQRVCECFGVYRRWTTVVLRKTRKWNSGSDRI